MAALHFPWLLSLLEIRKIMNPMGGCESTYVVVDQQSSVMIVLGLWLMTRTKRTKCGAALQQP